MAFPAPLSDVPVAHGRIDAPAYFWDCPGLRYSVGLSVSEGRRLTVRFDASLLSGQ